MDEMVQAVMSGTRSGVEVTAELLKILAPALAKGSLKILGAGGKLIGFGIDKISDVQAEGLVSRKTLFAQAAKANTEVKSTDSYPQEVTDKIVAKAKEAHIPVSVNGEGAIRSVSFLERDKDVINQIMQEWQWEKTTSNDARQGLKGITISEQSIDAVKSHLEQNGVECWLTKKPNGDIRCNFAAENEEKVQALMEDYKSDRAEIEENFKVTANVPETARQLEIKEQIAELENTQYPPEAREQFYEAYANSEIEFPTYSEENMEIIRNAMPDAKQVAGKAFWEKQGFTLNEDAKGIEIVAPEVDKDGNIVLDADGNPSFTKATVYDISETNAFEISAAQISADKINELRAEYDTEKIKAFEASENKEVVISDGENSITLNANDDLRKTDVTAILREEFGYTPVQAELAANKLADELSMGESYYAAPSQMSNLDKMQVNIRYASDDITIRDVSFSALKLKDGENVRLNVTNGDNSVLVTPAELSDSELKEVLKEQLGMSESQAEKAVAKSRKIDSQIQSKLHETVYSHDNGQRSVNIERTSQNAFMVKSGDNTKIYDFNQINLKEKIASDFGIPVENAHRVVQKAQGQSVIQNKIRQNAEKKRKSAKAKDDPFKNKSKKVSR